jgi:hypothetical protein
MPVSAFPGISGSFQNIKIGFILAEDLPHHTPGMSCTGPDHFLGIPFLSFIPARFLTGLHECRIDQELSQSFNPTGCCSHKSFTSLMCLPHFPTMHGLSPNHHSQQ